ncbi:hypothetical protein AJ80_09666 [Polytolypa hystricis UAMH7299]|uniref:High osmolarity sensitivity protein 3 n=1 Tax=Polytolypa hystricis (strain UAMH7299) TaxID=1447883 RepID=A0A2B7WM84_POLH7|nr:hypothetical protein AJ80_09666 [Polytolypa hystricis UAMH7299]
MYSSRPPTFPSSSSSTALPSTSTSTSTSTPSSSSSSSSMSSTKSRQYAHLHSQLSQLNAHLADTENLLRMTAAQAGDMRFLGGYVGGLFMGAAKVLGEEGGGRGGSGSADGSGSGSVGDGEGEGKREG